MAGGGERNRNHWSNASGAIHGNSSRDHHADYDDLRTSYDNGVELVVSAFDESVHLRPPSNHQLNLNAQGGGPFGLSLRKSTSLLNLIETTLTQENLQKIRTEDSCSQSSSKKLKASNFPAIFLQIGSWNWVSRNEGDLVAKLYYGKKKLVWEFLFGSLKRKMEISWSEISAINGFVSEGGNGRLEIELNVPPQFGQEINSQPGKHTQWTTMADFTGDQALICRRHKVEFLPGVLDKHFEKLLQCDSRLLRLSQQPFPIHNSPYFPNTYLNFSNSASLVGCSSIPVANCHQQEFFSHVGHLDPSTGTFIGHSSLNILPYLGTESIIQHPQSELHINDTQNLVDFPIEQQARGNYNYINYDNHFGYNHDEITFQEPSFWLPDQVSINDSNKGNSVMNHMGYLDDEICSVYQPGINNGVGIHEPSSWLPVHINSNYEGHHVHPLDPRMDNYGTLHGNQNYKP